jgi:hypothetical protein
LRPELRFPPSTKVRGVPAYRVLFSEFGIAGN